MKSIIAALGIAFAPAANASPCHHYATWHYPYPQPSCGGRAGVGQNPTPDNASNWYVEIQLPTEAESQDPRSIPFPVLLAQSKDELNILLLSRKWSKTLQKPWIDTCVRTSTPEQCETAWEKLNNK
jgi:hypothetical protein